VTIERGLIVIADVSGYGEFIATTELEHSREIIAELLGTLCESAPGGLMIAQLEGDAVFWLCPAEAPDLVDLLKEKFVEFHRRLRFMTLATTCPCRACAAVGSLTLKFVVHHGSYVRQRVAELDHFVGGDVVLAHRLLKNSVPSHEYILLTEAALAVVAAPGSVAHQEHVESHGTVHCASIELSGLRARALADRTEHLGRYEAQVCFERTFPVRLERLRGAIREQTAQGWGGKGATVWEHYQLFDDPGSLNAAGGLTHELVRLGARGSAVGLELHCHHQADGGQGSLLRLIRSESGPSESRATVRVIDPDSACYITQILSEVGSGSRIEIRYAWEPLDDPGVRVPQWVDEMVSRDFDRLALILSS
jgi:uncharacterized protein DUF2652